jgi:hypothetical protein
MRQYIRKRIKFTFLNTFTHEQVLVVSIPYVQFKATTGFYSKLYKRLRVSAAHQCETRMIKGRHEFAENKSDRVLMKFSNNVGLDIPFDINHTDIEIIKLYFKALSLAIKN